MWFYRKLQLINNAEVILKARIVFGMFDIWRFTQYNNNINAHIFLIQILLWIQNLKSKNLELANIRILQSMSINNVSYFLARQNNKQ